MMMRTLLLLLLLVTTTTTDALTVSIRSATANDIFQARKILFAEAMNPLSLSEKHLLIAQADDDAQVIGFGQVRPLDGAHSELASLYVSPEHRNQGIGSDLVETLLKRHDESPSSKQSICLLTLAPTMAFYQKHGFEVTASPENLPSSFQFEYKAGSFLSNVLGNDIVCMVRETTTT